MPAWLGVTLLIAFGLVAGHRVRCRDVPGTLMALGMAIMSVAMADLRQPDVGTAFGIVRPSGPWWAAGFALIALWPLISRRAGRVCGGPAVHMAGGLAMIYMCLRAADLHDASGHPSWDAALAASASPLSGSGHAGHGGSPAMASMLSNTAADVTPVDGTFALVGWALACYFLLATVTALTRRNLDGTLALPSRAAIGEAVMGFGTVIMLVAMT
jgi:hypothetical protein